MKNNHSHKGLWVGVLVFAASFGIAVIPAQAQTDNRPRTRTVRPTPTPTPSGNEPLIISRAEDFPDENGQVVRVSVDPASGQTDVEESRRTILALQERIKTLEAAGRRSDPDAKQRRLLLNLDILTRAEQRVESLRKQMFEMVEKESTVQARLESLEIESRPDMIERSVAFAGSLRPEELREAKARQLASERTKLQTLVLEIQRNKSSLEANIIKAEDLVERLRTKLERDIDEALKEDEPQPDKDQ